VGATGAIATRRLCAVPLVRRDRRDRAVIWGPMPSSAWLGTVVVTCDGVADGRNRRPDQPHFCLGRMTRNSQYGWTILVVSDEPARLVVKRLRQAGFVKSDGVGSHVKWRHPESGVYVVVPTGHRKISPGVVRQVNKAIERSKKGS
jgi:predicted RNA binding protein YcfA (HicA-like mRNA interferase family)